jgi:hypothetical protein
MIAERYSIRLEQLTDYPHVVSSFEAPPQV